MKRAIVLSAILLGFALLSFAQAPVPLINLPLVPDATPPGGSDFTLTVNGTGFVSNSVVNWNGSPLATQFVSQGQLTATVPAADIATASTAWVTVVSLAPGGGTSNRAYFTVAANVGDAVAFTGTGPFSAGGGPDSLAIGDFNGDGKLDLAVLDYYDNTLSILLGDGSGNFTFASSPATGYIPYSVAVGDFNGDGKLDLATANNGDNNVSILLGDGLGNFTLASSPPAGTSPYGIAVADFNRDGNLDLAVTNYQGSDPSCEYQGKVSILIGDGTGNFTLGSSWCVGFSAVSVVVGDFNRDGILDLAVANADSYTVSVLLGDGAGNFALASSPAVGAYPWSLAVGDFNGDGQLDLATADQGSNTVSILLGDGAGAFTLASSLSVGLNPLSVGTADFNGDGKLDLAVTNCGWYSVSTSVLLGDGAGNFTTVSSPQSDTCPWAVAIGDFDADGMLDIAAANFYVGTVSVLLERPPVRAVTLSPTSLTFGTQLIGTASDPQLVTLTNSGNATLEISSIVASANFVQKNDCPSELAAGAQCTIGVAFRPHSIGTITGTITITDNAPNSPQTVPLTGVGTAVTLLPSNLNFGNQQVGTTSQPQTITLTNYAPKPVKILGSDFTGSNPGAFAVQSTTCAGKLPAGESCTANITFTPRSKGQKSATFNVNDNAGASPQTVSLGGNGT